MRVGRNFKLAKQSFVHLIQSDDVDLVLKVLMPFFYSYLYARAIGGFVKRKIL